LTPHPQQTPPTLQNSPQFLIEIREGLLLEFFRNSVVRLCNAPCDRSQGVTVAAYRYRIADCILKADGFKKRLDSLGDGLLTGLVKPIRKTPRLKTIS